MVALIKYKPVYRVTVEEEEVGYIANRYEFEKRINENLIENDDSVVSSEIEGKPEFSLQLVAYNKDTNEDEIFDRIGNSVRTVYRMYALTLDGETKDFHDRTKFTYYLSRNPALQRIITEKNQYKDGNHVLEKARR